MDDLKTVDGVETITEVVILNIHNYETSDGTAFQDLEEANLWQTWLNLTKSEALDDVFVRAPGESTNLVDKMMTDFEEKLHNFIICKK